MKPLKKLINSFKSSKESSSIKLGTLKMFSLIAVVTIISWGISYASNNEIDSATKTFSMIGVVSAVSDDSISIEKAKGSITEETSFSINTKYVLKTETSNYSPLALSDVKVGDKIIAQGVTNGSIYFAKRIVSFTSIANTPVTETASEATSTVEVATTTGTSTEPAASESSSASNTVETPTSTEEATTTEPVVTPEATTTEEAASSAPTIETPAEPVVTPEAPAQSAEPAAATTE